MRIKRNVFIFLVLTILSCNASAQDDDFGLWLDAFANKKIQSSEFSLYGEFFTRNNNRSIDRVSIGLEGDRSVFRFMKIGLGYLLMNKNNTDDYELRHRFYTHAKFKWEVYKLRFSLRERYQVTRYPGYNLESPEYLNYWRNKMKISYEIPSCKIKPVIGVETFVLLNKTDLKRMDEVRYSVSALYPVSGTSNVEFYALLAQMADLHQYILGVSYLIDI
ncbi:DUF2490 domain-containing protein [Mariniphaga sediminis]|uniref:DUF2490 domain-containing protein n=1 Tax=Mariniphaga sediminis TaxID=1628158 RepID=UPI0035690788